MPSHRPEGRRASARPGSVRPDFTDAHVAEFVFRFDRFDPIDDGQAPEDRYEPVPFDQWEPWTEVPFPWPEEDPSTVAPAAWTTLEAEGRNHA